MSIMRVHTVLHLVKTLKLFPIERLEALIKKVNPSKEAQEYLDRTVYTALGMAQLLGDDQ